MSRLGVALFAIAGLAAGAGAFALGRGSLAADIWALTTAAVLVPVAASVGRSLAHGDVGVDAIALVAMAAAIDVAVILNALRALGDRRTLRPFRSRGDAENA